MKETPSWADIGRLRPAGGPGCFGLRFASVPASPGPLRALRIPGAGHGVSAVGPIRGWTPRADPYSAHPVAADPFPILEHRHTNDRPLDPARSDDMGGSLRLRKSLWGENPQRRTDETIAELRLVAVCRDAGTGHPHKSRYSRLLHRRHDRAGCRRQEIV